MDKVIVEQPSLQGETALIIVDDSHNPFDRAPCSRATSNNCLLFIDDSHFHNFPNRNTFKYKWFISNGSRFYTRHKDAYMKYHISDVFVNAHTGNINTKIDEFGFTYVNINYRCMKDEPFVLSYQCQHAFYVKDPIDDNS
ncbi:hypothetical protein EJ110_NYTH21731 [Nymphaea thermarum]|nr:hypothetical protein EJ110_NYTH21731 [Nymphaea thermarum]